MARTNSDGKSIKLMLRWLLNREDLQDADIALALGASTSSYSRHKDDEDFPSFEELEKLGHHFGLSPKVLQIAFGLRDIDELILLDNDELLQYMEQGGAKHYQQYMEQGGANLFHPPPLAGARKEGSRGGGRLVAIPTLEIMLGSAMRMNKTASKSPPRGDAPWAQYPSA